MNPSRLAPLRPFIVLAVFFVVWLLLPIAVKRSTRTAFQEFQAPVWQTAGIVGDLQSFWSLRSRNSQDLIDAGRSMARLNAGFNSLAQAEIESLRAYNERLRRLLGIPPDPRFQYLVARVVRRDLSSWWQRILVRQGRDAGVTPGAGVIFSGGVVGRVVEVNDYTSVIELISSPTFRMAARFREDRRPVRFDGEGSPFLSHPVGRVRDVPSDLYPRPDQPLILESTRLGGVFPDGVFLGTVRSLETGVDGLFQTGPVELPRDLLTVEEVTILLPFDPPSLEVSRSRP